jgi:hypothetical protein
VRAPIERIGQEKCPKVLSFATVTCWDSTYGQTLDAHLEQLKAVGCAKIYREKASGAQADRRELLLMLGAFAT